MFYICPIWLSILVDSLNCVDVAVVGGVQCIFQLILPLNKSCQKVLAVEAAPVAEAALVEAVAPVVEVVAPVAEVVALVAEVLLVVVSHKWNKAEGELKC